MMSKSDKSDEVKIFKNISLLQSDCIIAMLIRQGKNLQEPSFAPSETDVRQKTCLDPLRASIWEPFGNPKSIRKRSGSHLERYRISNLEFKGLARTGREVPAAPNPTPPTRLYIY